MCSLIIHISKERKIVFTHLIHLALSITQS